VHVKAINVFEGGRRTSKLVIAIWLISCIVLFIEAVLGGNRFDIIGLIALAGIAFGGVLFILAFTWAIGWIVRGFMGIPRGQDKK